MLPRLLPNAFQGPTVRQSAVPPNVDASTLPCQASSHLPRPAPPADQAPSAPFLIRRGHRRAPVVHAQPLLTMPCQRPPTQHACAARHRATRSCRHATPQPPPPQLASLACRRATECTAEACDSLRDRAWLASGHAAWRSLPSAELHLGGHVAPLATGLGNPVRCVQVSTWPGPHTTLACLPFTHTSTAG